MKDTKHFVHNVYFWLKNPNDTQEAARLEKGIKSLSSVEHVHDFFVGKPASTNRPVIDSTYSFHLMLAFVSQEKHDAYQIDPIHEKFVEACSALWGKVQIYDAVAC